MGAQNDPCREVRQRLTAYIDAELSPEESSSIDRHIADCLPCSERAGVERGFTAALRARQLREQAPPWLVQKVRQALERESAGEPAAAGAAGGLRGWRLALAGAGYALAVVFAYLWLGGGGLFLGPDGGQAARGPFSGAGAGTPAGRPWVPAFVRLRAQVVCAACERAGVPVEQHSLCDTYGHFNGLRDDRGRVWLLVQNEGQNRVLQEHGMRGRTVDVEAEAFEDVGYLIARNVHEL